MRVQASIESRGTRRVYNNTQLRQCPGTWYPKPPSHFNGGCIVRACIRVSRRIQELGAMPDMQQQDKSIYSMHNTPAQ